MFKKILNFAVKQCFHFSYHHPFIALGVGTYAFYRINGFIRLITSWVSPITMLELVAGAFISKKAYDLYIGIKEKSRLTRRELYDINQGHLIEQLLKYLTLESQHSPQMTYDKDVLEELRENGGFCNGFSLLWVYYCHLGKEETLLEKYFDISSWNGNYHQLTPKLKETFEYILNAMIWLQQTTSYAKSLRQSNKIELLNSILPQNSAFHFERLANISFVFQPKDLKAILQDLPLKNHYLCIDTLNHAMVFRQINSVDGQLDFQFYDPNLKKGHISVPSINALVDIFFNDNSDINLTLIKPINDKLTMFQHFKNWLHDSILGPPKKFNRNIWTKRLLEQNLRQAHLQTNEQVKPLHMAAFSGHSEVIRQLLAQGAEVNPKTQKGHTPIEIAIAQKHEEVCFLLKSHITEQRRCSKITDKPFLFFAIRQGDVRGVELNIRLGFDVNEKLTEHGFYTSPLSMAIQSKIDPEAKVNIIKLLLQAGADPNQPTDVTGTKRIYQLLDPRRREDRVIKELFDKHIENQHRFRF